MQEGAHMQQHSRRALLVGLGVTNVGILDGGIIAWSQPSCQWNDRLL